MKTATLTFHASHNYGSMLQAYALQQILYNLGVENEIINLRTDIQKGLIPPQLQWCHPCSSLVKLLRHPIRSIALQRKYHRFEKFLVEQLHLTPELSSKKEVEIYLSKHEYDALIVGSDQIWNPACWDFDTSYLLSL